MGEGAVNGMTSWRSGPGTVPGLRSMCLTGGPQALQRRAMKPGSERTFVVALS
jgi:hypothetical protein